MRTCRWALVLLFLMVGACREQPAPVKAPEGQKGPSQWMNELVATSYEGNTKIWDMKSPKADVIDTQENLLLSKPDIQFFKEGQLSSRMTAEKGRLDTAQQNMRVEDNVIVVSTDGARLETSWLIFDSRTQLIHSTAPARIIRSDSITRGNNLVANMSLSSVTLTNENVEILKPSDRSR